MRFIKVKLGLLLFLQIVQITGDILDILPATKIHPESLKPFDHLNDRSRAVYQVLSTVVLVQLYKEAVHFLLY